MTIWKKVNNPEGLFHDQWEGVGIEALIRESDGWFDAYLNGKRIAGFRTLATAKKAIEDRLER